MKAVLSNRIYINCDKGSELGDKIANELTYVIDQMPQSEYPLVIKNMIRVTDKVISIPSGREDLIPEGYEIIDKRTSVPVSIPKPGFSLRGNQAEAAAAIAGRGLLNAKVGWGKTIAALGIAHNLQQKTLIICTTTNIRDMWVREVKKWFGFDPGVVGGGKFDIDSPIVVGNIQTIVNRIDKLQREFGLVIVDEVHRSTAKTFTKVLNSLTCMYKMGLSGTLERKDGMHCVLPDYFGFNKFVARKENTLDPVVHYWDLEVELSSNPMIPWANKITKLISDQSYIDKVVFLAKSYADAGHKVLLLSDRVSFLEQVHFALKDRSVIITGAVKNREEVLDYFRDSKELDILVGMQSIFSEGVSENSLSCVILATPINNEPLLEQICGRVQRKQEGKMNPVVVDLGLKGQTAAKHRKNRSAFYIRVGFPIQNMGKL